MKLDIHCSGPDLDALQKACIRTTVGFAAWHDSGRVRCIRVLLGDAPEKSIRCVLVAETAEGAAIRVEGAAGHLQAAVQEAADRLEVTLWRAPRTPAPAHRIGPPRPQAKMPSRAASAMAATAG